MKLLFISISLLININVSAGSDYDGIYYFEAAETPSVYYDTNILREILIVKEDKELNRLNFKSISYYLDKSSVSYDESEGKWKGDIEFIKEEEEYFYSLGLSERTDGGFHDMGRFRSVMEYVLLGMNSYCDVSFNEFKEEYPGVFRYSVNEIRKEVLAFNAKDQKCAGISIDEYIEDASSYDVRDTIFNFSSSGLSITELRWYDLGGPKPSANFLPYSKRSIENTFDKPYTRTFKKVNSLNDINFKKMRLKDVRTIFLTDEYED